MEQEKQMASYRIKILKDAMIAEKMSIRAYDIIFQMIPSIEEHQILSAIRRDEKRHYFLLQQMYEELTGEYYDIDHAAISLPKDYIEILKTIIYDELESVSYYEKMSEVMVCIRQKEIINQIVSEEKDHARLLAAIYKKHSQ